RAAPPRTRIPPSEPGSSAQATTLRSLQAVPVLLRGTRSPRPPTRPRTTPHERDPPGPSRPPPPPPRHPLQPLEAAAGQCGDGGRLDDLPPAGLRAELPVRRDPGRFDVRGRERVQCREHAAEHD